MSVTRDVARDSLRETIRDVLASSGFRPSRLFSSGEQGAWYDPSDYATMFVDSAGTTPVTGVEQSVGLILDKSKGLVLGSEMAPLPLDFTAAQWTTAGTVASRTANSFTVTAGSGAGMRDLTLLTVGKRYYVSVSYSKTNGTVLFAIQGASGPYSGLSSTASSGVLSGYFTADQAAFYLRLDNNDTVTVTAVSVRELPGNHASQSTTASKPTLRSRYNLLTYSEQFDNAAWALLTSASRSANYAVAPDGTQTADRLQFTAASGDGIQQLYGNAAGGGVTYTVSLYAKSNTGVSYAIRLKNTHAAVLDNYKDITVTPEWQRFDLTVTNGAGAGSGQYIGLVNAASSPGAVDISVWGADLRVGSSPGTYQRIASATDYDTNGFQPYLAFDGVDDSLVTANVDFSATDKMSVFAGVTKLSDAAEAVVLELSSTIETNNGAFNLFAPGGISVAKDSAYVLSSKGTIKAYAGPAAAAYPAPITNVVTGTAAIATDSLTVRVNGTQAATAALDQGTGNYGNYPLYIGRRGGTSAPVNGNIYSLIVRGAASSAAEIASTEKWVAAKTGVALA